VCAGDEKVLEIKQLIFGTFFPFVQSTRNFGRAIFYNAKTPQPFHLLPGIFWKSASMNLIAIQGLCKWVFINGNRNFLLNNLNLNISEGEFISIMGPSGSGKSTLLNVLGMLDGFDEGQYHFMGEPVHTLKEKQRTQLYRKFIGFVFQQYHLIDELTVFENIETPLMYQDVKSAERKARVADMLDRFNMVGKKDLFPAQLSGGQQQLVGIARALIGKPQLILADEPTGNLSSKQSEEIMELFRQINKEDGVTILQVTHSEKNATYGSRIIHLLDGRIVPESNG
jgi:ABC-type lipoprotein export system ATPase subunit